MKWPENKQDRQKIYALIGIGVAGALYGLWAFVYQPLVHRGAAAEMQLAQLEQNLRRAQQEVRRTPEHQRDLLHYTRETLNLSERHMLHPVLGNYLLQARALVRQHSEGLSIRDVQAEEVGLVALPRRRGEDRGAAVVQGYALRVSALAGYADTVIWLSRLVEENPLLTIHSLSITAQPEMPERHQVRLELHWPVWIEPAMRQEIRRQAEALVEESE